MYGELIPVPGGDPIPLLKKQLRIGRRDGCDIVLNFSNISGHHALMEIVDGFWFVKDLRSRNGVKVDGKKILQGLKKRLDPGVVFSLAKHTFKIRYDPTELGDFGEPPPDEQLDNLFRDRPGPRPGPSGVGARIPKGPKGHPPLKEAKEIPREDDEESN